MVELDQILNIRVRDYVESKGKTMGDYDLKGVRHFGACDIEGLKKVVPTEAEAVVEYNIVVLIHGHQYLQYGVALIPKESA